MGCAMELEDDDEGGNMKRFEGSQNFINTQIPLTWLITAFVTVVVFMIGVAMTINNQNHDLNTKMDTVLSTMGELKKRADERDTSFQTLRELQYSTQRMIDAHDLRLNALEHKPNGKY